MRTLRYLGVLAKTGLRGIEADNFLEKVKSMPELLDKQERFFLIQYGVSLNELKENTKYEVLDMFRNLGLNLFISEKTRFINDEQAKKTKVKELRFRLGRVKVIFNDYSDEISKIVNIFSKYRLYNESFGFGKYCKSIEEFCLRIESRSDIQGNEYFVITEMK